MLRLSILLFTAALGIIVGLAVHFADDRQVLNTYTGTEYCGGCHASTAAGEIVQVWASTPHARAASVLESDTARAYLREQNIDIASCYKCHTTLGRTGLNSKETEINAEGVGCERCHGAGSEYSQTSIMKDRYAFEKSGGSPGSLENCYSCHASDPANDPHCPFQTDSFDAMEAWPAIAHPVKASRSYSDSVGVGIRPDTTSLPSDDSTDQQ